MEPDQHPLGSFETWAASRQHALLRSTFLITADLHRAEDLVQDALFKVALRWDRLQAGNPDAYIRTIINRSNISWWRSRRESPLELVNDELGHSDPDPDAQERPMLVRDALARLTLKQRAVLVLRYFDDLTEAQTAEILGVTVGTVKKQAAVAQQRLREIAPELRDLAGRQDDSS